MTNEVQEKIAICKAKRLLYLDLSHHGLTEIPPEVGTLVWLERLTLSHNHISDISQLSSLKKIHKLSLSHNQISDLSALASNERLKFLFIQNNRISDITPLKYLHTLKKIVAHDNNILDIQSLTELPQLVYLDLVQNPIKNRQIFKNLNTFQVLKG